MQASNSEILEPSPPVANAAGGEGLTVEQAIANLQGMIWGCDFMLPGGWVSFACGNLKLFRC